ncbi:MULTISPECIES: hypothetical protein [Janibacter]|jgi:spore cortex formation protein SpoVR/YcgB (stage V sporulation)|uniref:hypothetical protein n=1 Tax=Janibacter TaxID=53457 RepID=UPI00082D9A29|nr:hypothetical protein [Janibacter terrae]MBA4084502.1 hypothetical protein [Kytococcus sp.]HBO54898.1 hypothetical protein [Janibacter terrae]HCE61153.1 hypothetical protein [Janibacter terrae]
MIQLFATFQVLGAQTMDYLDRQADVIDRARQDRGSITIEQVLWAVAAITVVGIVFTAIKTFVQRKTSEIN